MSDRYMCKYNSTAWVTGAVLGGFLVCMDEERVPKNRKIHFYCCYIAHPEDVLYLTCVSTAAHLQPVHEGMNKSSKTEVLEAPGVQVVTVKMTLKWMYRVSLFDVLFVPRVPVGALTKEMVAHCFRKTVCCRLQEDQMEPLKDGYDQVIPAEMWGDMNTVLNIAVQGLSKRFEQLKFGIFYLLIVKIRYNFTHK